MKKTLLKNAFAEIHKSRSRFLSIFGIVAIGVGFFSGVNAASPDMKLSGDIYYDELSLSDYRLVSTYGFTEDDISALEKDGVTVIPSYFTDALMEDGEADKEVRLIAFDNEDYSNTLNSFLLDDGRLPSAENECISLSGFMTGACVGDKISLTSGTDTDLSETLTRTEFTVVGVCHSPLYIDKSALGSTTIGSGRLNSIIYVPRKSFKSEYFTQIYLKYDELDALGSYSEEYKNRSGEIADELEQFADEREQVRFESVISNANAEISDAENTLSDKKAEAEKELSDAMQKLTDGEKEISENEEKLSDGKKQLEEAEEKLIEARKELDTGKTDYESGLSEYNTKIADAEKELSENEKKLLDGEKEYAENLKKYNDGIAAYNDGLEKYNAGKAEYEASLAEYNDGIAKLADGEKQLAEGKAELEQYEALLGADNALVVAGRQKYEEGLAEYESSKAILDAAKMKLDDAESQLSESKAQLDTAKAELDEGKIALDDGRKTLDEGNAALQNGKDELEKARADGKDELDAASEKLANGEKEYADGIAEIADSKAEIADAEKKLAEAKDELSDGYAEYEKGKAEADEKIADAEQKLSNAKQEVADLEEPVWYIFDRFDNPGYSEYSDNADRINNISKVFPVFFILVAALVCLTTMTRMVEEQRTQLGTMKALGYGNGAILFKYLLYALSATMLGSIVGLLLGQWLFPFVIMRAYGMLYTMSVCVTPYYLNISLGTTLAAVLAIALTVYFSIRFELKENPAELIRPKPPRMGKRIFLERVTPVWKHLKFSKKVTLRNIFRYKRRMLMTVVGIAGCTALTLTGFALRDSISDIITKQYDEITAYSGYVAFDGATDAERQLTEVLAQSESKSMKVFQKTVTIEKDGKSIIAYIFVPSETERLSEFVALRDRQTHDKILLTDDGVILDEKSSLLLNLRDGDEIEVRDGDTAAAKVSALDFTENYPMHYIYMTEARYELLFGELPEYNMFIYDNELSDAEQSVLSEKLLACDGAMAVQAMSDTIATFTTMLAALDSVMLVLIVSAGILAFVVLYNLSNVNITERIREISTLKVLGFYDKEADIYILRENVILTAIGTAAGLFLGIFLAGFVISTAEIDIVMFGRDIHPLSYLYAALLTFAFSAIVAFFMHFKLKTINMVEAMKSVE